MTNGKTPDQKHQIAQDRRDEKLAADPNAHRRPRYNGTTLELNTLSADDFKYILQQCDNSLIVNEAVLVNGKKGGERTGNEMQRRVNGAEKQGGDPGPEPNTQPEATPSTFNRSGYSTYTPSARVDAFVKEVNAWDKANLHTGGKAGKK